MSTAPDLSVADRATHARIMRGLRLVTAPFPHLAGLAAAVRVEIDERVPTMGVFASGRLLANPAFTARLSADDLVFVLAHELLHLALRTHDRARGSAALEFNYAHDYIINDMLRHALGTTTIPAGGLDMQGARERSAEDIVLEMRRTGNYMPSRTQVWEGQVVTVEQVLGAARQAPAGAMGDALDAQRERELFPEDSADQAERAQAVRDLAGRGMVLAKAMGALRGRGDSAGGQQQSVQAQRGFFHTPWHVALQAWLDGAAPGERTYTRASRRGHDRSDVVIPGRKRHSWMLNVILDTSASMSDDIPKALGAIADFCDAAGVDEIRVVQCDSVVTSDEVLSPSALADYQISGYGGSDLTPALEALSDDPRVSAAIVITDGDITYPNETVSYAVLWALPKPSVSFQPSYGRVVVMQAGGAS
ncbi:MAG TPA: VWA-like domain-containing protein [Bosea sp. (in: a-proteobacteria)]|jgi:predicted metal-dependent peptidase|nr:VWA-like domain-containing protein [Bosea sp. (in: a-proteobacteria)]